MKSRVNHRLLAVILVLLMVLQILPITSLSVNADTVTHTFEAATLTADADKEVVAEGTTFADGYFTVSGKVTKRTKSDAVFCVELEKKNGGGLSFEVSGTATVTVWISSTGGSNESTFNLLDANGIAVADKDGNTTPSVTGTTFVEVTYENLPAGTYQVACPSSDRNTRLQKLTVTESSDDAQGGESAGTVTSTYTFNSLDLTADADKEVVAEGTTFADGYFTVSGKVTKRTKSDAVFCVELEKKNGGGLSFEVSGTATVTVWISSTGGSNESTLNLLDASGAAVADKDGNTTPSVTGTTFIEVTYENLPAGTYQVACPNSDRNTRLQKAVVVETTSVDSGADEGGDENAEPVTSWDFTADEYTGQTSYNGLIINGSPAKHDSTYGMRVKSATIDVPVSGPCEIQVTVGYNWDITFPDGSSFTHESSAPVVYKYTGEAGTVAITVGDSCTSYIAKIELAEITEPATSWDFTADEYTGQTSYNGLIINGSPAKHDSTYGMRVKSATIDVPVSGPCEIQVTVGYNWDITFPDGSSFTHESSAPVVYKYTGEAGTVAITVGDSCTSYIAKIELAELPDEEPDVAPEYDTTKIYVWDFAGEQLDTDTYINMIDADEINSWFEGVEAGTTGKNLVSFTTSDGQLSFNDGGYTSTHRLRVNVSGITCYDTGKYLQDADGNVYNGYIYSNKGADATVYISIQANAGDILTFVLCSNGTQYTANLEAPSGAVQTSTHAPSNSKDAQIVTFYVTETGTYKLYYTQEKMVVARIYRESTNTVTVTGNVTAPAALTGYSLVFTNTASGAQTVAPVVNGSYSVSLNDKYTYDVSLSDANGYIITSTASLTIEKGAEAAALDVTVEAVTMVTVTGSIIGLSAEQLADLKLSLISDAIYVPEITISGTTYTVKVEIGQEYTLVAEGVNDYYLTSATTLIYTENTTADITFAAKATYAVTIVPEGCELADLANATFTFTNLNEEGYVYTFTGIDEIVLRDGTYSVVVKNVNGYVQKRTSNLKVNGAAVSKTIGFEVPTAWDFRTDDFTGQSSYNGVTITGSFGKHGANYGMQIKDGTVTIPVSGACEIMISVGYTWDITVPDGTNHLNTSDSNAVLTYSYTGGAGNVVLTIGTGVTTYIRYIELKAAVAYKETVTVGASGCDYTTIGDAMEAVRAMNRPNNERVTILIQPGNYEEMLVVDVPNVTLKNASENPSIGLTNAGVDIEENAVRITWYYGHGYTYYSMGADYKFDATILQVNKENGYASTENPGAGTATYWNASVVIAADGFRAEGIIFENSFNQYISAAAANDVLVKLSSAKEGSTPRAEIAAGSTLVQDKSYVERATALAITDGCTEVYFENCKFIGRQDTLYGGTGSTVAFYDCDVYGSTDYIFGGMTAVFAKCDLVFNTSENSNDVGYITAAQQTSGRGYLMYNCRITSTTPGVDTASQYESKPGYYGRPWAANTAEVVFYNTVIDATCNYWYNISPSLIRADGWLATLSGESALCGEYGTYEYAEGVDNSGNRVSWAAVFETEYLADGTPITIEAWLGSWDAFVGKDMTIDTPNGKVDNSTVPDDGNDDGNDGDDDDSTTDSTITKTEKHSFNSLIDVTPGADKDTIPEGTVYSDGYFTVVGTVTQRYQASKGGVYAIEIGKNLTGAIEFTVTGTADVTIVVASTGGSNTSEVAIINTATGEVIANNQALTTVSGTSTTTLTYTGLEAGTYQIVSPVNEELNRGFRLMTIDVEETVEVPDDGAGDDTGDDSGDYDGPTVSKTFEHSFDSLKDVVPGADKDAIASGTVYSDGYFTVVGVVTQRYDAEKGGVYAIEIGKNLTGAMQFTVTGTADVTIVVSSTGGSNTSEVAIINVSTGEVIMNNEGLSTVSGTSGTTLTYTGLEAGTYKIVSPVNDELKRGFRLMTIDVLETVEVPDDGSETTPITGDAGIALAAAMLVISVTAVVVLPRKKFF